MAPFGTFMELKGIIKKYYKKKNLNCMEPFAILLNFLWNLFIKVINFPVPIFLGIFSSQIF